MGTTRVKVIDLSSDKKEIKTSRKHAEKLSGMEKIKKEIPKESTVTKKDFEEQEGNEDLEEKEDLKNKKSLAEVKKPLDKETPESTQPSKSSQSSKSSPKKKHMSKNYRNALNQIDREKLYSSKEAIELLEKTNSAKFDQSVEVHLNVADKTIKGSVNFPNPLESKNESITLIFADQIPEIPGQKILKGDEKTVSEIESGKLKPNRDFNKLIATPKYMASLAKIAKILGPANLMPNPKNNTVTEDVKDALGKLNTAGTSYKSDPAAPIIHMKIGKISFKEEKLNQNLTALILAIGPSKIKKATITSTMGVGIKFDPQTISQ